MVKISVCVPTFNSAKFIRETIESVLNQTYQDFELLIVDDYSKDETLDIVQSIKDARIRIFKNEKNLGMVRNFNRCLELAQGEFVTTLDGDDLMASSNLQQKIDLLEKYPEMAFVFSNVDIIDESSHVTGSRPKKPLPFSSRMVSDAICVAGGIVFKTLLIEGNFICKSSVILRRNLLERFGSFNVQFSWGEDYDMWARMALSHEVGYVQQPLVKYRIHTENYTKDFTQEKKIQGKEQMALVQRTLLHRYFATGNTLLTVKELVVVYQEMLYVYFVQNRFRLVRKIVYEAMGHGVRKFHILKYYLLSWFPLGVINWLRKI